MGTRRWTLSTFIACCLWILHGLGAVAAVPVTTEGLLAVGTASPVTAESEGPGALVMGTMEMTTMAANAETAESILAGSQMSPSFSPRAELDAPVTAASEYDSTAPTLTNTTKPLNTSQDIERGSAAAAAATTAATISLQHPIVTPEAELDATGATPNVPLGTTPLFADVKEDILAAVTREGAEDLDPTTVSVSLPTTPPLAAASGAQPTAGSPVGAGVTTLQTQGLTTAMEAVEKGVTMPMDIQSEVSGNSLSTSTGTGGLLTTQQDKVVSEAMGITPEPAEEMAPAAGESPLVLVPGNMGDEVNGEFSTASSSHVPLDSPTVSGTVTGEPSLLPGQAVLSPPASLASAISGDGDGQGAPSVSSEASGSALSPTASEAPEVTEDTATSLLDSSIPTDAQSDSNLPVPAPALPRGDVGTAGLAKPPLQPAPWQTHTGEQPLLPSPTDTLSASRAAYPSPGAGAATLPAADDGADTPAIPDLGAAQEALVSPSPEESQSWGMATGASQGVNGPDDDFSLASNASTPASFVPGGLAWPAAGVQGRGVEDEGDTAQAGSLGDGSSYADTQNDTSSSASSTQQDPTNAGELPAGGTGASANAELSPPSALGDGVESGAVPALGQVFLPDSTPPGSAGPKPNLSGAEELGNLPSESTIASDTAYPAPGAAAGPVPGAETPANPNLGAAQGALESPSPEGSQTWGTADGSSQGTGLSGASGPGTGLTSLWDAPSSGAYGQAEPPSPALGDQLGTNLGLLTAEEHGASTAEQAPEGASSGTGFEPSLSSISGSGMAAGMDQLPGAGSSSGPASPSAVVAESSVSEGDGSGPILDTAPGPDSLSLASPDSETGPEFALVQGTESTGDVAQEGNPGSESPYMEIKPSASSAQQDSANAGELPAGETGDSTNAELSPPSALGDGAESGAVPALGQVFLPDSTPPGSAGPKPNLSGAEELGNLPSEFTSASDTAYPAPGAAAGPVPGAETPANPNLGAAQGALESPSPEGSQTWGTADGSSQGTGLSGASGPGTGLTSLWDAPSSGAYGQAEPPSPALGDQLGTNLGLLTAEEHGASTAEQAPEGASSGTGFEPSLSSISGSGMAAGMDQLPGAGSSSGPASPSAVVAESSVLDPASLSAFGKAGGAPGALQPSMGAGPWVPPAAGEGAGEAAGDRGSLGQSQAPATQGSTVSGAPTGEMGAVLWSLSSSPSMEESSSPGMTVEAANGASLPGAGGASSGLRTGLETLGPEEPPVSAPSIQSGAHLGLSDSNLSQVNVVELPGRASVNGGPSPGANLEEGAGAIIPMTSVALAPSALVSPQETQPLVPVAPDSSGGSNGMASSLTASLLLPGHGLSSGLTPIGDPRSAPSTQSGSRSLVPGAPGGLEGNAGGAQTWPLEDEVASGMPAPLGEASLHALVSPNAAPVLPSAPQRENAAEGVSTSPGISAPLSACESIVGPSAGGRGELGTAMPRGPPLLLPPHHLGSPGAPSGDVDSLPGDASAMVPGAMAGRENIAQLLPSATGAGAGVDTPGRTLLEGTPGLPSLPPAGVAAGSPGSKTPGLGPAGGSLLTALHPFLGGELITSLAKGAPATGGSNLPTALPGQGVVQGGSPTTACPAKSCSPATTSPALPAPSPEGRKLFPRPGASTVTSRASSPVFPAPPRGPAAAPTPLPSPAVAAVPLYGYGSRENDQEYVQRRVDFNSPLFKPETGFPFGKTLRDALYFTDNGQIIFPDSDNSIFTYPNPPPSGFNGHEDVPMIAVFWDNADFSRGVGTTFYQEFLTLNTAKPPFVRDVEAKIRRYLRSSYSAAWTLKITWEKAPAYAARTDTRRTITYQAILTTDGFRSYVLMLYQQGGMQWDYTRLAATNVLIGYTSGDGSYRNDDLTQRPPAAKYRPDQFRGYNTDLRGLWIYKLESRVGVNYRLKCLAWTGRQQEPQVWNQGLPTCPCSLQQGQQDSRFKSSRRGWWATRISMLHSASPNQHGAGVRCLYDSQGQLIEGRQERYWRSSRQASPYRDQELKLYDWCCNQAGSARLCAHYSEKRPKIGCDGYQSPGTAGSSEETESDSEEQRDGDDK